MSPLQVTALNKTLQKQHILHDICCEINGGEIFGLIGLNGAGKTTLIKAVLDLHRAESGRVEIFGIESTKASARSDVYYLPEKFMPPASLTGEEFLRLSLSAYGVAYNRDTAEAKAASLALQPGSLKRRIKSYSKGMGQKLGLVAALMAGRRLLILDEPMSGLDPEARRLLRTAMQNYRNSGSIFFSSHILSDIEIMCDRIGVINDGRMLFTGKSSDLLAQHNAPNLEDAFLKCIGRGEVI